MKHFNGRNLHDREWVMSNHDQRPCPRELTPRFQLFAWSGFLFRVLPPATLKFLRGSQWGATVPHTKKCHRCSGWWQGWGWGSYSKKRSFRKQKEIVFTAGFAFLFLVKSYLCGSDTSIIHFSLGSAKSSRSGDRTVTREVAAQSCLLFASPWHFVLDLEQLVKPSHRLLVETMTKKITKYTGEWGKSGYSSVAFPTFPKCHSQL